MSFQSCKVTKFPIEIVLDRVDTENGVLSLSLPPQAAAVAGRLRRRPPPVAPLLPLAAGLFAKIVTIFLPQIIEITSLYNVFLSDIWKFD